MIFTIKSIIKNIKKVKSSNSVDIGMIFIATLLDLSLKKIINFQVEGKEIKIKILKDMHLMCNTNFSSSFSNAITNSMSSSYSSATGGGGGFSGGGRQPNGGGGRWRRKIKIDKYLKFC